MAQGILLDSSQLLEVIIDGDHCQINYGFHTFHDFHRDDLARLRVSVIQLVTMGVNKSRLARIFKIHRKTIENWEKVLQEEGIVGLINLKSGRNQKCNETIERYINELDAKLGRRNGYKQIIIDEVKRIFGVEISRELIRQVLIRHKSSVEYEEKEIEKENTVIESTDDEERIVVKNGGVLLSLPLLEKHNVSELIPEEKGEKTKGYSFKEIAMTVIMLLTGGLLKNEEQVKINDSPCMGAILRRKFLPSLRTVRRIIPALLEKIDITKLKEHYASFFLKLYVDRMIFYIDGHFMPYHGQEKILYGYNPIRRMAMKGRTSYVVNTETGRPIFQILSDNFDNFKDNIIKLIRFLKKLGCRKDMLLVFDRGGFGEEFLNSIYKDVLFICWYKGKASVPRGGRWEKVTRYIEGNVFGERERDLLEVKEDKIEVVSVKEKHILRRFFIRKGEKISVGVTNDLNRPIEEVVRILTKRWGVQENVFKELKKIGYDNIHSYWKVEYSQDMLLENEIDFKKEMANPEYKASVDERKILKASLEKLRAKLGKQSLLRKKIDRPTKSMVKLKTEIEEIEKEIEIINERIKYLPEKILRFDYIKENGILKLGSEKKEYFDLMKFISYNARRDIAEIVGPVYKDNRDIHTTIIKWLKAKCELQKLNGELVVTFPCPSKKNESNALRVLCEYLNSLGYRHFNTGEIMRFHVT